MTTHAHDTEGPGTDLHGSADGALDGQPEGQADRYEDSRPTARATDPPTATTPAANTQPAPAQPLERDAVPPAAAAESSAPLPEGNLPPNERPRETAAAPEPSAEQPLFAAVDLGGLRTRWNDVQAGFVDDPRRCVEAADGLVSDVVRQLVDGFSHARTSLEDQWSRGEDASTEDLRLALRQYRDFFERLLAV